jgi:hypothetical protein
VIFAAVFGVTSMEYGLRRELKSFAPSALLFFVRSVNFSIAISRFSFRMPSAIFIAAAIFNPDLKLDSRAVTRIDLFALFYPLHRILPNHVRIFLLSC